MEKLDFKKAVKLARIKRDMTVPQLAQKAEVGESTIYNLGNKAPSLDTISKIANAVDMSVSELMRLAE